MQKVKDIRRALANKYANGEFIRDKTGSSTVEIIGATFIADEPSIFGKPNDAYIQRELQWYLSKSLFVDDIPGEIPAIWKQVCSKNDRINSNYGWCIWSDDNYNQYDNVLAELKKNPYSRRAEMIYTRPSMHVDFNFEGMSDFICTDSVSYFVRDDKLVSHVKMRSNDSVYGYGNDRPWQKYVQNKLASDLGIESGDMIWTASSLHVYSRHFKEIEAWIKDNGII